MKIPQFRAAVAERVVCVVFGPMVWLVAAFVGKFRDFAAAVAGLSAVMCCATLGGGCFLLSSRCALRTNPAFEFYLVSSTGTRMQGTYHATVQWTK